MGAQHYPDKGYLVGLAIQAGSIAIRAFHEALHMERTVKSDNTPLTVSDIFINRMVIEMMKRDFPHISVIGEEESRIVDGGSEYTVVLDPIDGTIPFCSGMTGFTFCISVLKGTVPIIGLIHDPITHRTWYAELGNGCFVNDDLVRVNSNANIKGSHIQICWWDKSAFDLTHCCVELMASGAKWMNQASVALGGALVASGHMSASIFAGSNARETCAIKVLVEEAGGRVTDIHGGDLEITIDPEEPGFIMEGHIVSNGLIHDDLVEVSLYRSPE